MNLAPFSTLSADPCAFVRVCLLGVAIRVLSINAPRGNRAGGTCSLAEGGLEVFTSDEPRGGRADAAFVVGTLGGEKLHSSTPLPLGRSAML